MENFGIIDVLRTKCADLEYAFLYGEDAYRSFLANGKGVEDYSRVLLAEFTAAPTRVNSVIQKVTYSGYLALGQKKETTTISSIDEFPIQKYDRRLKYLTTLLSDFIGALACENDLTVTAENYRFELNKHNLSADYVACEITFVQ